MTLFPLPLVPFESYYWSDDREQYPTVFPVELTFSGAPDRAAFTAALEQTRRRHPLLCARIERIRGRLCWIADEAAEPCVDWQSADIAISDADLPPLDLRSRAGLRAWVRAESETSRVVLQFHHACCDGLAALAFAQEVLVAYHALFGGASTAAGEDDVGADPVQPHLLHRRGDFGDNGRPTARELVTGLRHWSSLALRQCAALPSTGTLHRENGAPRPPTVAGVASAGKPGLSFLTHAIDLKAVRALRRAAAAHDAMLNDLLLRDLFLVLADWLDLHDRARSAELVRINVPTNLRGRCERSMPAANRLSFAFITRRIAQCRDPVRLLRSIRDETSAIRQHRLGMYFLAGLSVGSRVPRVTSWFLRRRHCFATAVFSNLGRLLARAPLPREGRQLVAGNLVVQRITGVPPIRPLTRAAVAVGEYGDEMTINLQCDPHHFSPADAERLLAQFADRLAETQRALAL